MNDFQFGAIEKTESILQRFSLPQIYYWWQLAGGDVHSELRAVGLIRNDAPILSLPKLVMLMYMTDLSNFEADAVSQTQWSFQTE